MVNAKSIWIAFIALLLTIGANAQWSKTVSEGASNNQVLIKESDAVSALMTHYINTGKQEPYIDGWRIKLISTTDRRALERAKELMEEKHPEEVYALDHEAPYYSMKVGAFENRIAVDPVLALFKEDFPLAIPYRDKIMKTELFIDYE